MVLCLLPSWPAERAPGGWPGGVGDQPPGRGAGVRGAAEHPGQLPAEPLVPDPGRQRGKRPGGQPAARGRAPCRPVRDAPARAGPPATPAGHCRHGRAPTPAGHRRCHLPGNRWGRGGSLKGAPKLVGNTVKEMEWSLGYPYFELLPSRCHLSGGVKGLKGPKTHFEHCKKKWSGC